MQSVFSWAEDSSDTCSMVKCNAVKLKISLLLHDHPQTLYFLPVSLIISTAHLFDTDAGQNMGYVSCNFYGSRQCAGSWPVTVKYISSARFSLPRFYVKILVGMTVTVEVILLPSCLSKCLCFKKIVPVFCAGKAWKCLLNYSMRNHFAQDFSFHETHTSSQAMVFT